MPQKILKSSSKLEMGSISVVWTILKTISKFFAALFKQLLNFRIFLFLKFFAKSIHKLTRGDYVSWGTIVKTLPNTEITRFDGTTHSSMAFPFIGLPSLKKLSQPGTGRTVGANAASPCCRSSLASPSPPSFWTRAGPWWTSTRTGPCCSPTAAQRWARDSTPRWSKSPVRYF